MFIDHRMFFIHMFVLSIGFVSLLPLSARAINPDLPEVAYVELPSKEWLKQNQLTLAAWMQQTQQQHPGKHLRFQECRQTGQESTWGKQCSTPYGEKSIAKQDFAGWIADPEKKITWRQQEIAAREKYLASYFGQAWDRPAQEMSAQAAAAQKAMDMTAKKAQEAEQSLAAAAKKREALIAQQNAAATELAQVDSKLAQVQIELRNYVGQKDGEAEGQAVTDYGRQLGDYEQRVLDLRKQYQAAEAKLEQANGQLNGAQQDLTAVDKLKGESVQAFLQAVKATDDAKQFNQQQRERLDAEAKALAADATRQLAMDTAANTFQQAEAENRMHEILTLKQEVLQNRFKLTEQALDFLATNVREHLHNTLLGKYINSQIGKLAGGLCELQKKCISELITTKDVEELLRAPVSNCNP